MDKVIKAAVRTLSSASTFDTAEESPHPDHGISLESILRSLDKDVSAQSRILEEENLNKIIYFHSRHQKSSSKVLEELCKEIKRNSGARSLKICLGALSHINIKPQKLGPTISNILPCIIKIVLSENDPENVLSALSEHINPFLKVFGPYALLNEVEVFVNTFIHFTIQWRQRSVSFTKKVYFHLKIYYDEGGLLGSYMDKDIPLIYAARLIVSKTLLTPTKGVPRSDIRISIRSLAISCMSAIVSLSPKIFLLTLYVDQDEEDFDTTPLLRDIASMDHFVLHEDPQLSETGGNGIDFWFNQRRPDHQDIIAIFIDLISKPNISSISIKYALTAICSFIGLMLRSSIARQAGILLFEVVSNNNSLWKNSYWLVKTSLLDLLSSVDFKQVHFVNGKGFELQNKFFIILKELFVDEDTRVRLSAADAIVRSIPNLYYPHDWLDECTEYASRNVSSVKVPFDSVIQRVADWLWQMIATSDNNFQLSGSLEAYFNLKKTYSFGSVSIDTSILDIITHFITSNSNFTLDINNHTLSLNLLNLIITGDVSKTKNEVLQHCARVLNMIHCLIEESNLSASVSMSSSCTTNTSYNSSANIQPLKKRRRRGAAIYVLEVSIIRSIILDCSQVLKIYMEPICLKTLDSLLINRCIENMDEELAKELLCYLSSTIYLDPLNSLNCVQSMLSYISKKTNEESANELRSRTLRPVDSLLSSVLTSSVDLGLVQDVQRWLGFVVVSLCIITNQSPEEGILSRLEEFGITLISAQHSLNEDGDSVKPESTFAKFLFQVIGASLSKLHQIVYSLEQWNSYLEEEVSLLLNFVIYVLKSTRFCRFIDNMALELSHAYPFVTLRWAWILSLLKRVQIPFWSKLVSFNSHFLSLDKAILQKGSLIVLCDYLCETNPMDEYNVELVTWLVSNFSHIIVENISEEPICRFVQSVHNKASLSGLFLQAIISRCQHRLTSSVLFQKKTLIALEQVHDSHSFNLLTFLIQRFSPRAHLSLSTRIQRLCCKRVDGILNSGSPRELLSAEELSHAIGHLKEMKLTQRYGRLIALLNELISEWYPDLISPMECDDGRAFTPTSLIGMKPNKVWFLSQLRNKCSVRDSQFSQNTEQCARMLDCLNSEEDISSVISSADFNISIFEWLFRDSSTSALLLKTCKTQFFQYHLKKFADKYLTQTPIVYGPRDWNPSRHPHKISFYFSLIPPEILNYEDDIVYLKRIPLILALEFAKWLFFYCTESGVKGKEELHEIVFKALDYVLKNPRISSKITMEEGSLAVHAVFSVLRGDEDIAVSKIPTCSRYKDILKDNSPKNSIVLAALKINRLFALYLKEDEEKLWKNKYLKKTNIEYNSRSCKATSFYFVFHPMEDEIIVSLLRLGICKAISVLGVSILLNSDNDTEALLSEDKFKRLLESGYNSPYLPSRFSSLQGVLYILQRKDLLNDNNYHLFSFMVRNSIEYLENSLPYLTNPCHDYHAALCWSLTFYILENYEEMANDVPWTTNVLQLALCTPGKTNTSTKIYLIILSGFERLILAGKLTKRYPGSGIRAMDQVVKLTTDLLTESNPVLVIPSIQLFLSTMYGSGSPAMNAKSDDGHGPSTPERLMHAMEQMSILFDCIRRSGPKEAHFLCQILPCVLVDFFPAADIINRVITEFISPGQPHQTLLAGVMFSVFKEASQEHSNMLQDWILTILPTFVKRSPISHSAWCLSCFFLCVPPLLNSSIQEESQDSSSPFIQSDYWLQALFPHLQTRLGSFSSEDKKLFCLVAKEFYSHLQEEKPKGRNLY
ncbi:HD [Lepeophtheirus salmonis]|uniref:HD n=1 Tax=Lepeophtheirus salmonis TaxID=72036 RepID=A0A7R8CWB6_LEPSM|nr:HD [Lepeophtheirus salmonis]CAF2919315.1 HD [Lepeophtheirus salmonis]